MRTLFRRIASTLVALVASACSPPSDDGIPEPTPPPVGARLVLELGELQVHTAFDGELCTGSLARIERHVLGLSAIFDIPPPRVNLILYTAQGEVDNVCPYQGGCTNLWESTAHALPWAANHELVHLFVHAATTGARTRPAIEEGVAKRLEGKSTRAFVDLFTLERLKAALATDVPHDPAADNLQHFFAWAIEERGIDAVMDAHIATSRGNTDEEVGLALATSLGFASLADLHSAFVATEAFAYPDLPGTAPLLTAQELTGGVWIDTSCAGDFTEGPNDGEVTTVFRIEVARPGEYEISYEPLDYPRLFLKPHEIVYDSAYLNFDMPRQCSPAHPARDVFEVPGHYEVTYEEPVDNPRAGTLVSRYLGEQCSD